MTRITKRKYEVINAANHAFMKFGIFRNIRERLGLSVEKCLQRHITLLASKREDVENIQIKHNMETPYSKGVIEGLDLAIKQLQTEIKYLKNGK